MTVLPPYEDFAAQASSYTVVPVWREVFGDVDTPVGVFDKLGAAEGSVLLESADSEERWGRFSFVGLDPLGVLTAACGQVGWVGSVPLELPARRFVSQIRCAACWPGSGRRLCPASLCTQALWASSAMTHWAPTPAVASTRRWSSPARCWRSTSSGT